MKIIARKNLRVYRVEAGLSMSEFSKISQVPLATISRVENGDSLSPKSARRLCEVLQKPFYEVFEIIDEMSGGDF